MIDDTINKIREFNSLYMSWMGLSGRHYLSLEYSVPEVRILSAIYMKKGCNAAYIAKTVHLDKSYFLTIFRHKQQNFYKMHIKVRN